MALSHFLDWHDTAPQPTFARWTQVRLTLETLATHVMRRKIADIDVPTVRELIETLADSGAEIYACKMAMELMHIERDELVPQVQDVITAMDFFEKSEGAQVIFI